MKFYFPFPFSDKIFCDIQHVMNRRNIIAESRTVRLIRTPAALIYHAVLCCIFAVSLSIIHETQIPFTFFRDFLKKFSGEMKNPTVIPSGCHLSGLRHPASTSCKALVSCWPLPQQLLPVSATGGGRRCCLLGAALAKRSGFAKCQGPPY